MAAGDNFSHGQVGMTGAAIQLTMIKGNVDSVKLKNMSGANRMFVGGPGVTATDGFPIQPNETLEIEVLSPRKLFVIGTNLDVLAWATVNQ